MISFRSGADDLNDMKPTHAATSNRITSIEQLEALYNPSFAMGEKVPKCVLSDTVERVYYQCQKALVRSRLWSPDAQISRSDLTSAGRMLAEFSGPGFDAAAYDSAYPRHLEKTIY